jgi:hypothetical protein
VRKRTFFSLVGALVAAIALASASGAATAKAQKVTRIDVSTRAAVIHYLHSIHVNAKGAVIQRGLRNYAGARCPGKHWTCASTRHTVVQIAKRGGENRFVCRSARCAVVQFAGVSHGAYIVRRRLSSHGGGGGGGNSGVCIKLTGLTQSCTINQSGAGPNSAVVYENAGTESGLTQTASYTALITQVATGTATTNGNTACVTQNISLTGSTTAKKGVPVTVTLAAHQSVTIQQDVAGAGTNNAVNGATSAGGCDTTTLGQSQILNSVANGSGSITQNEDAAFSACGDGVAGDYANLCLKIDQNQHSGNGVASGPNNATFVQSSNQQAIANTPAGPVSQTQSTPDCTDPSAPGDCVAPAGLVGTVNQYSTGVSTADATQTEKQCEDAATSVLGACTTVPPAATDADFPGGYHLTQNQYGPVGVGKLRHRHRGRQLFGHLKGLGAASQTGGNSGDMFMVHQTSTQDNDNGSGGSTNNQTNTGQADCHSSGNCTVMQKTTVDGQTTTNTQSGQNLDSSINCTGTSCQATVPPAPIIDSGPTQPSTTSTDATFTFHDADTSATFLCKLDSGAYSACTSPKTYNALDPGSHTFSVEAKDTNGNVGPATSYAWAISSDNANVLIAGTGDFSDPTPTEPNDNLAQALTAAGYSVTESATLPADLSSFGQVWWVDANPMTSAEQNQLINFEETGRGVYLTGERPCCETLNAADQTIVNSVVSGGGVTVGGQGDVCGCNSPLPVNPTVVGNLATQPHTVTSWQPSAPGGMAGVPAASVFSYYQPGDITTRQVVAAAWDRPSTVGNGRLVVFMDINWPEVGSRAANWSDVAENVAFFLSGLSSPPTPPVLQAPIMGLSLYGAPQMTPARAATPAASGRTTGAR